MTTSIPTEEEFQRAANQMRFLHRNWDEIQASGKQALLRRFDLHEFAVFPNDCSFEAILFFETQQQANEAAERGAEAKAREILLDVIRPFRPDCEEIVISIELDSYENVKRHFGGNYLNRLR